MIAIVHGWLLSAKSLISSLSFTQISLNTDLTKVSEASLFGPAKHLKRLCAKVPPAPGSDLTGKLEKQHRNYS